MTTATKTIYPTIPDIVASQPGTIIAAVQALKNTVNLLIVNSQSNPPPGHMSGAKVFTIDPQFKKLSSGTTTNSLEMTELKNNILKLQNDVNIIKGRLGL